MADGAMGPAMNPLWLAGRATGLVSLLLLSAAVVLGTLDATRTAGPRWPRFVVGGLHRNASLLGVAFLAVHIVSAVVDPYAGIGWLETVVPFVSGYRPFALGLGTVAIDLILAVTLTSVLRHRVGYRSWRAVHLTSYGCWLLAVVHGLLIGGADTRTAWVLAVEGICVVAVAVALLRRALRGTATPGPRTTGRQGVRSR